MRNRKVILSAAGTAASAAIFWAVSALGQQQPVQQADGTVPKFTTSSNLVIVDVTVKDKSGKPIENLKQTDFLVTEDGKPQRVEVFEFQKLTDIPEPPAILQLS